MHAKVLLDHEQCWKSSLIKEGNYQLGSPWGEKKKAHYKVKEDISWVIFRDVDIWLGICKKVNQLE